MFISEIYDFGMETENPNVINEITYLRVEPFGTMQ